MYFCQYTKRDRERNRFSRNISELDKEVRAWDLYAHVEAQVRNMMSSLRAVSELQNPAIKHRHWQELMAETRVNKHTIDFVLLRKYARCNNTTQFSDPDR